MPSCRYPISSEKELWNFSPGWLTWRLSLVFCFLIFTASFSTGQSYPQLFGANWDKALLFTVENRDWMRKSCRIFRVDYTLAVSVVFPELVRYSALRDKIEITLLKALYTQKGAEYADFSVGVFQMKPSCAEALLEEISGSGDQKLNHFFDRLHRSLTGREKRAVILKELEDPGAQFIYVLALIRLLDKKYGNRPWKDMEEKVRFYAAAYNSGFNNPENRIRAQMNATSFHTGLGKPSVCYSYAALSAAFFHTVAADQFSKDNDH